MCLRHHHLHSGHVLYRVKQGGTSFQKFRSVFLLSCGTKPLFFPSIQVEWAQPLGLLNRKELFFKKRFFAALLALTCMLSLSACREEQAAAKPVIYLYPEEETAVTVKLDYAGALTCTYPAYGDGWAVTACPDGTLTDDAGQTYSYLYWEGTDTIAYDFSQGFCVAGTDTAAFLEDALAQLGLTRREANEFIVYWLPQMQENPYNLIAFQSDRYTQAAKLTIDPPPDTLLRVFMAWKPLDKFMEIPAQSLTAPERTGFTAVEWGGCRVR